jgi:hypothetical protein
MHFSYRWYFYFLNLRLSVIVLVIVYVTETADEVEFQAADFKSDILFCARIGTYCEASVRGCTVRLNLFIELIVTCCVLVLLKNLIVLETY